MLENFKKLEKGQITGEFLEMIRPVLQDSHDEHIDKIENNTALDSLLGLSFFTKNNIYKPTLSSSSVFILRSMLKMNLHYESLLDMGTGSGAIGLNLINNNICKKLTLTDISEDAIECVKKNAEQIKDKSIEAYQSNVFSNVKDRFDCIVFNLPLWHKDEEVLVNEISLSDQFGKVAKDFFEQASNFLNKDGEIWFTYSNLSNPLILESALENWNINLVSAEFTAETGFWIFLYRAKLAG